MTPSSFNKFRAIVRKSNKYVSPVDDVEEKLHAFDERNVHPDIARIARKIFDDGHYSQATFEAFKFIDKRVQKLSKLHKTGYKLMMEAFNEVSPKIQLNELRTISDKDEQHGFKFIFSGAVLAIRNPRGHEYGVVETLDQCLDHISLASLLLRRLDKIVR